MKPEELTIEQTLEQMREVIDTLNDADGKAKLKTLHSSLEADFGTVKSRLEQTITNLRGSLGE